MQKCAGEPKRFNAGVHSITTSQTQTFFRPHRSSSSSSSSSNSFLFFLSLSSGLAALTKLHGDSSGGCLCSTSSGRYLGVSSRSGRLLAAAEEASPSSFTGFCSLSREPGRLEAYLNPGPLFCFNTRGDKTGETTLYLQLITRREAQRSHFRSFTTRPKTTQCVKGFLYL